MVRPAANPYRTSATANSASASLRTSTGRWPLNLGIQTAHLMTNNGLQPGPHPSNATTPTSQVSYNSGGALSPFTMISGHSYTPTDAAAPTSSWPFPSTFSPNPNPTFNDHGNSNTLNLLPVTDPMPSPHSEDSGRASSSLVLPVITNSTSPTPAPPAAISPRTDRSSVSRRPSTVRVPSDEPPRHSDGKIYCDHEDCADDPPTFVRKCEWRFVLTAFPPPLIRLFC